MKNGNRKKWRWCGGETKDFPGLGCLVDLLVGTLMRFQPQRQLIGEPTSGISRVQGSLGDPRGDEGETAE